MQRSSRILPILGLACLAGACQEGGVDNSAASEVKLAVDHHLTRIGGAVQFDSFPVKQNASYSETLTLHFEDDGQYSTSSPGNSRSTKNSYFLEKSGKMTLADRVGAGSTLRYTGYYDLEGDSYWFLIRSNTSRNLLYGVRQISGKPTTQDEWHVFGHTLLFADSTASQIPSNVARAFDGDLEFDGSGAITLGSVKDSRDKTMLLDGRIQTASLGFADFAVEFKGEDSRSYTGGIAKHVGVLSDKTWEDGEVGTIVLMRKMTGAADATRVAGTWKVGLHALFNNPGKSGTDAASADLVLESDKTWKLSTETRTVMEGKWDVGDKGALTFVEDDGFNQRFTGAVDPDYRNLVFVDKTIENSADPFVALYFGIREIEVK